jgi:rfaE bifunctional protein kinase chain/domain
LLSLPRLESLLSAFPGLTIGLAGDLFLDRYLEIDPELAEVSIETGLEAYQITRVRNSPGALGTIINNLAALGVGRMVPVTVIGDDGQAYDLLKALARLPVDAAHVIQDGRRQTPTYTKPLRRGDDDAWRELNRLDIRNRAELAADTEQAVVKHLVEVFQATDGLIVLDQVNEEGWGVITPRVRRELARLAAEQPGKLMFIDSRRRIGRFGCGTLKPNRAECLAALGLPPSDDPAQVRQGAIELCRPTGHPLFCTQGERGIMVVRPDGWTTEVPAVPVTGPIDIVGAGDSATAAIVASLLAGADEVEAATLANLVASITIEQLGTTGTATPGQVLARGREHMPRPNSL